jgi:hypothetical protein
LLPSSTYPGPQCDASTKKSKKRKRQGSIEGLDEKAILKKLKRMKDFSELMAKVDYSVDHDVISCKSIDESLNDNK